MLGMVGTVLVGLGTSLNAKVIADRLVYGKKDKLHWKMVMWGTLFMLIGQGLRSIDREGGAEIEYQERSD